MKQFMIIILVMGCMASPAQQTVITMHNNNDSLSYFLGLSLGYELQSTPFESNSDLILQGFIEAFKGIAPIDQHTTQMIFQGLQMKLQLQEAEKANLASQEALEKGNQFLLENGRRAGVTTTASGLQYEVLVKGEGPTPADTSEVEVHYEGSLIDGKVFDSSYERGEPISFPLNRVIPGWTEGVQQMPVGSTYMLYIPSELAYGSRGSGPIPANSVLVFKIELLGIH
ncbi:MAG: FKBP-type peptidyl-prolyl cis-trans isomerase [Bacteroidota bacterium]